MRVTTMGFQSYICQLTQAFDLGSFVYRALYDQRLAMPPAHEGTESLK